MEIVSQESIKVSNSVIVKGLTNTSLDEEISTYLGKYGSINRHFRIDDLESEFHQHVIFEFRYGTAMESLQPLLPLTVQSSVQPELTFEIKSLAEVYALSATRVYMKQICEIANLCGNSLEDILKKELANLQVSPPQSPQHTIPALIGSTETDSQGQGAKSLSPDPPIVESSQPSDPTLNNNLTDFNFVQMQSNATSHPTLALNPPSVQRVVVEHVVRSGETPSHTPMPSRFRAFSGLVPRPNNEADYDMWRTSVEVLIKDPAVSDLNCTQRILDSLLPPATDLTKHLGPHTKPSEHLKVLDSAFGAVEDGDELFARFMNTLQDEGERPSTYLQRLHVCLRKAMRHGGVSESDFDKQLLKQFCRGCWEDCMISDLQLEQRKGSPPSFSELLLLLRTEEDKQTAKVSRMRQRLGRNKPSATNPKQRAMSHVQTVSATESDFDTIKKQIADLSAQLNNWKAESQNHRQSQQKPKCQTASAKVEARPLKKRTTVRKILS